MKLVLAEKPSVAQSIAKVLGATKREDGYLEGNGYVVSWCVGHLVELSQPEAYDEKYNKWAYADLPIFPDQWKYQVSASTKKQFGILKKLMARKDVESLVCATDAGREGELIFRLVYQQAGCRKPFERLWISSMEDSAIREGFEQLKPSTEYDALYEAALCRERADWLVGINATRLFSTLYGQTLNVGRVMTPTLAMVVMREAAISAFRPEPFYTVELAFQDFTASGERMKQKVLADDVARKCVGSVLNVTKAENKEKSEKPPALYDLTSLQRDANRVLGFTAQQTLDYTQSLYEKKLVTYPRTDSRYLTSDMKDMLPELIKSLFNIFPVEDVKNVPVHAAQVINDKKVSDHHAIIPTKEAIKCSLDDLPKGEQAILRLIATRLFCAVGEPFRYNESVIELSDGNYIFSAKGKTTVQSGWKIFSGKPADKDKEGEKQLPSLTVGEGLSVYSTEVKEGKTSPPKHFTEDTLLQSMETAGADEMPEDAERKGLGTPATRAATIEKLVRIGFLERKGDKKTKHLISTHKGTALVTVMPEQIQSPSMTADWEEKLLMIERGEYDSNAFLKEIQDMISALVQTYEKVKGSDEFKDGKQPAFRHSGEKRFIRLRSLGEGYSQEDIIAILSGKSVQKASRASRQVHTQREFNLLIDIQEKMAEGKSAGYERWAKKYNRKEAARTVCLLKEKGISNYEELTALTEQLSSRFAELSDTIKANEKRMVEIGALQTHINNYSRTRSVYEAYRKSGYSIKFFEEHREEIQIHKAAKKAFDQLPGKKVPTRQSLNEEYHRLLSGKKEAYAEYRQVKKDMQEYLIAKQTVEHILGIDRKNRIITQQQNLD